MRLIDADKLKEILQQSITKCDINKDCCNCCYIGCIEMLDYDDIENIINAQPTVERPKGKWKKIFYELFPEDSCQECSVCHKCQSLEHDFNFCPHCGADMREVEE